jgi:hypothetical protein
MCRPFVLLRAGSRGRLYGRAYAPFVAAGCRSFTIPAFTMRCRIWDHPRPITGQSWATLATSQAGSLIARELLEGLLAGQHVSRLFCHGSGVSWLDLLKRILMLPVFQDAGVALRPDGGLKKELRRVSDFKL